MACEHVSLPGGGSAIVCGTRSTRHCACGRKTNLLCDWKVPERLSGTCDKPICSSCTTSPAKDKDLCPAHAEEFATWRANRSALA